MKAEEIRIGNWLNGNYNGFSKNVTVYEFDHKDIQHTDDKQIPIPIGNFKPIPITATWFTMFGFEVDMPGYYYFGEVVITVEGQVYFGESEVWIAEINFVHQLQNLFFALTGRELELVDSEKKY